VGKMINTAEMLSINDTLREMGLHESIRKYLLIDIYGVKYYILRIKSIEYHEKVDERKNKPFLFIAIIEIGLYGPNDQLIGEYTLPLSETKLISVARSIKNAYKVWKRRVSEVE
jgi:hypothetical protein